MFKNMRMGFKIGAGFGLLIVIALALGGLAFYNMHSVSAESTKLATEYVPEVNLVTEIQDAVNRVMYNVRGYVLTEKEAFYEQAQNELDALKGGLKRGEKLAQKATNLVMLGPAVKKIGEATTQYEAAMHEVHAMVADMHKSRASLEEDVAATLKISNDFLEDQNQTFKINMAESRKRIEIVTQLLALATSIRVNSYKAQAKGDAGLLRKALEELNKVGGVTKQLRDFIRNEEDIARIDAIENATKGYKESMDMFLEEFQKGDAAVEGILVHYGNAMDLNARSYVKNCDELLAEQQAKFSTEMTERNTKVNLMNQIVAVFNNIQLAIFKAQATNDPQVMSASEQSFVSLDDKYQALREITHRLDNNRRIAEIEGMGYSSETAVAAFTATWKKLQETAAKLDTLGNEMIAASMETSQTGLNATSDVAHTTMGALDEASMMMLIGVAVALVLGIVLATYVTLSITRPVNVVITGLTEGAEQVAGAAGQVSTSSQSLAEGASEQAASLEETTSSMEEMGSMTHTNAENARQADSLMKQASQVVVKANSSMSDLRQAMQKITSASEETGKIIKTIDEIAFQTNLLALNAAVEAARAGEAGAGFAVVADEVRNLAMRAAEAAKNTQELIEGNIKNIHEGSELMADTDEAFKQVEVNSNKVAELVSEIAEASSEQAQGIEQINRALNEMDKVTQSNAANAEQSAAAAEQLSAQSETMHGFVDNLVALVGSRKKKEDNGGPEAVEGEEKGQLALPAPKADDRKSAKTNPEEVIPMEDQEFKEF